VDILVNCSRESIFRAGTKRRADADPEQTRTPETKIDSQYTSYTSPQDTMSEQSDIFQFYSGSADVAPGKGAGETLVSSASTYTNLRKITGWRRSLAAGTKIDEILPLTGSAQLWEAALKKPKVRREDLETRREVLMNPPKEVKEQPQQQMEAPKKSILQERLEKKRAAEASAAAAAPSKEEEKVIFAAPEEPKPAKKTKKTTSAPENVQAKPEAPPTPVEVQLPDMEKEDKTSTIRFCPVCRYYLYLQVASTKDKDASSKNMAHYRLCRNCGYKEQDEKGGLLSEILVQEKAAEGYKILLNEHTRHDPRLPHLRGVLKCPDPACESNHVGKISDIIYMKYDAVNLLYLYICDICGFQWRSRR
jgi:hypothetical protein